MARLLLLSLLLALGCSDTIDVPVDSGEDGASELKSSGDKAAALDKALHPTLGVDENVADYALSAVTMWQDATGGRYAPETHIGCNGDETFCIYEQPGMVTECMDDEGPFYGCCDSGQHEIRLSEGMSIDTKVSTLAHELGHSLKLAHAADGLMNPHRSYDERHIACVDQTTLDAFAARYGGEGLGVVCYSDEIHSETLELMSSLGMNIPH